MGRLNKPAREGYTYRSPGQTNAKDVAPNLREDVAASQSADNERIKRGLDTSGTRAQNRSQVQNAAGRAITRTAGRAGLAGLAAEAGYAVGKKLDEETGVGKKIVDKSGLGSAAEKAANKRDKVELSKDAKARLDEEEVDNYRRETEAEDKERKAYSGKDEANMKKGGMTARFMSFSKAGKPAGMKPVTKMASGGVTASRRADGIAQRGKTRGKMV
jgi:hypothetical protein